MNILTSLQQKTIELLAKSKLKNIFYWTGGTLLTYRYFQHRKSEDLDFFSETPFSFELINPFIQQLKEEAKFTMAETQKIYDRWDVFFKNHENLRIEFVYYNKEKKTLKRRKQLMGIYVDSLEDIAANKVMAYFDRNEPKDLFDLYFLITKGRFTPQKLLGLVKKKFGVNFPESLFWSESFKGFKLLDSLQLLMIEKTSKEKGTLLKLIREYFTKESESFLNNTLTKR